MAYRRLSLLVLMAALLALTGCAGSARKEVLNAGDHVACVKRTDLRLIVAALNRNLENMESALKSGADVNATVEGLGPAIVISSAVDNSRAVQLLLDKGANINANDTQGHTALIDAALLNHREVALLLVSKGADVNTPSDLVVDGKKMSLTALMIARSKGHQDIVKFLTEAGAK
jgi:uncharacterized protein